MSTQTFDMGFRRGLAMFKQGLTAELISNHADASVYGNGMVAASEALLGWLDIAERAARLAGGHTHESAYRLVQEAKGV